MAGCDRTRERADRRQLEQRADAGTGKKVTAALVLKLALMLHGHLLTMHLVKPPSNTLPLIVYATGDGGWKRKDLHTYEQMKSWGYPIVGFSSPEYLKHLGRGVNTITPENLARDYNAMIDFAESRMAIAGDTPVILVGVSRGAGLSVAAAEQDALRGKLKGVVAVGLTREEEFVDMSDLYSSLPMLGPLPLAVVQSTHDDYLPAPQAQQLFGADSGIRRFQAVQAKNHNFSDAREAMYQALHASLIWIHEHS
jgi:pimeloyl-ACP methyl ester carboxylesterase